MFSCTRERPSGLDFFCDEREPGIAAHVDARAGDPMYVSPKFTILASIGYYFVSTGSSPAHPYFAGSSRVGVVPPPIPYGVYGLSTRVADIARIPFPPSTDNKTSWLKEVRQQIGTRSSTGPRTERVPCSKGTPACLRTEKARLKHHRSLRVPIT